MSLKKFISAFIAIQFVGLPVSQSMAAAQNSSHFVAHNAGYQTPSEKFAEAINQNPFFEDVLNHEFPTELGMASNDPAIDTDPFYLRSQAWSAGDKSASPSGNTFGNAMYLPVTKKTWTINRDISPILETDEYFIFAANSGFTEFADKVSDLKGEAAGEGMFFASREEVLAASLENRAAPIYFFPLPGSGWTGGVSAADFPQIDSIIVHNRDGDTFPIQNQDIELAHKAGRLNNMLAITFSLKKGDLAQNPSLNSVVVKPGMTAGFGSVFVGIDLKNPADSLLETADITKQRNSLYYQAFELLKQSVGSEKANAMDLSAIDPKLQKKLLKVAAVLGIVIVVSIAVKYSKYRDFFKAKADREAALGKPRDTSFKKIFGEVRDSVDTYAHSLTLMGQFAGVWFANAIEFTGDRFAPGIMAGKNTLARKFLDKNVYFVRRTYTRTPVNAWSWFMGTIVLGGIDTAFVAYQTYEVIPHIGEMIGNTVPPLKDIATDAFAPGNEKTSIMATNALLWNVAGYATQGAAQFSQELQSQLEDRIRNEVKNELKAKGIDPSDSKNNSTVNEAVDARMEVEMAKMGLPGKDSFMFDAGTFYAGTMALLFGYDVPASALKTNFGKSKENYLGVSRPGLVISSVKKAIADLENKNSILPNQNASQALTILKRTYKHMSWLHNYVLNPRNLVAEILDQKKGFNPLFANLRNVRREMMALTYEGGQSLIADILPLSWQGSSLEAQIEAGNAFRAALTKITDGKFVPSKPYAPINTGKVFQWQQRKAIRMANDIFMAQTGKAPDLNSPDQKAWEIIYRGTMMKVMGLLPDYTSSKGLEATVSADSEEYVRGSLASPELLTYLATLSMEEKNFYVAHLKAQAYANSYVKLTAGFEKIPPIDPGQPGRFQALRQREYVRSSTLLTRLTRGLETLMPNDRYEFGRKAMFERNIPLNYDFKTGNIRTIKRAITLSTAIMAFNWVVWDIHWTVPLWALHLSFSWLINMPAQTLNRTFALQGWKTMGKVSLMVLFGVVWTWATFAGGIPDQLFGSEVSKQYEQHIEKPVSRALEPVEKFGKDCKDKLVLIFTPKK